MKSIKNEKLIKRNGKLGQWLSLGALGILGLGMYISFTKPEFFAYSIGALIVGFVLTQVSMYMGNRWGKSPRPDEKIDASLKGLPGEFSVYHYLAPIPHFLASPAGLFVIIPYHQRGKVTYQKNRWRNSGGGFLQGYMRLFGQEGIGRPDLEAESEIYAVRKFLAKHMDEAEIPEIKPILLFTDENIEIEPGDSSIPAFKLKQLKEYLRQQAKDRKVGSGNLQKIASLFEKQ